MVIRQVVILNYRIKDFIYFFFIYSSSYTTHTEARHIGKDKGIKLSSAVEQKAHQKHD